MRNEKLRLEIGNTNIEIRNKFEMLKFEKSKKYDLEDRTLRFAKEVIDFVKEVPRTLASVEIAKQLIRSASSVGANYIEGNEALGKRDLSMRIKICKKEAKESVYWLRLIEPREIQKKEKLINEAIELMNIFGAILQKIN